MARVTFLGIAFRYSSLTTILTLLTAVSGSQTAHAKEQELDSRGMPMTKEEKEVNDDLKAKYQGDGKSAKSKAKTQLEADKDAFKRNIANLQDKNPEVRANAAEILGSMGNLLAVEPLIEVLQDRIELVAIKAHAALNKLTGKNFGYKNHSEWKSWWVSNKEELIKKNNVGADDMAKVRGKTANEQGRFCLKSGQYEQARTYFLQAVSADPEVADYRNNLGLSVMKMGRYIDAIIYFQETIGLDDGLPQPNMNIGACYANLNRHIEAQHWYRKALEKDTEGKLWEPCWSLGKEFLNKGDFHMAQEFLEEAMMKSERNNIYDPRIYRDLALTYYGLDEPHGAYKMIMNVQRLGFELDKGFIEKVRKTLIAQGVDPDKEDAKSIKHQRELANGGPLESNDQRIMEPTALPEDKKK